jgi:hypothetical protein
MSVSKTFTRGEIAHLIDSTGLKVFGEGEWKSNLRQRTPSYAGVSCIAVDSNAHEIASVQTCR